MAKGFYKVSVSEIHKTTDDCVIVSLSVPADYQDKFVFKQGQYLTLKADIKEEAVQRSYSICSATTDSDLKVGIKQVPYGRFSTYANQVLKVGDSLEAMPPNGNFYIELDEEAEREIVCFAAGSGITPIYSIIKTHLELEPNTKFKLFYINQTVSSIILKEELEALKNQFMDRFEMFHFLTKQNRPIELFNGRLDELKLNTIFGSICNVDSISAYFSCGPEAMIFMIKDFLESKGVDENKIHFELFTSSSTKPQLSAEVQEKVAGKMSQVTLIEGGKSMNFEVAMGGNNLLDAALNNSADLPYACKGGVCCTCRAKLIEGEVSMAVHYGLEKDELESGYILTCQALPLTEKIVIDFDA